MGGRAGRSLLGVSGRRSTASVPLFPLGGYGFIKEYPVEKLMRDAKVMQLH
jgi:alkylation response protein AidB-like acyl-CoA dehydrogenase